MNDVIQVAIHIGAPKTGSSAIQFFLNSNRRRLERLGYYYPEHFVDENSVSGGHSQLSALIVKNELLKAQELLSKWLAEATRLGLTLLLSSEDFLRYPNEFHNLLGKTSVKVFAYYRHPIEFLVSSHNQSVKRHFSTLTLDDFLTKHAVETNRILNGSILTEWQSLFGSSAVIVRPYDVALFKDGRIENDFLKVLGIKDRSLRWFSKSKALINTSYTDGALELKRLLNLVIGQEDSTVNAQIDKALQKYSDKANKSPSATRVSVVSSGVFYLLLDRFVSTIERMRYQVLDGCPDSFLMPRTVVASGDSLARKDVLDLMNAFQWLRKEVPDTVGMLEREVLFKLDQDSHGKLPYGIFKLSELMGLPFNEPVINIGEVVDQSSIDVFLDSSSTVPDYLRELASMLLACGRIDEAIVLAERALKLRPNGPAIIKLRDECLDKLRLREASS